MCADPNIAMISFTGSAAGGSKVGNRRSKSEESTTRTRRQERARLFSKTPMSRSRLQMPPGRLPAPGTDLHVHGPRSRPRKDRDGDIGCPRDQGGPSTRWRPVDRPRCAWPDHQRRQVERIEAILQDAVSKGAKLLAGGTHDGRYFAATVLSGVRRAKKLSMKRFSDPWLASFPSGRMTRPRNSRTCRNTAWPLV